MLQSENRQNCRRAATHERFQIGGYEQQFLLQVSFLLYSVEYTQITANSSYTYDITSTLQNNLTSLRTLTNEWGYTDRFAWNDHLLSAPFSKEPKSFARGHWLLPLIHGHVDQASEPEG